MRAGRSSIDAALGGAGDLERADRRHQRHGGADPCSTTARPRCSADRGRYDMETQTGRRGRADPVHRRRRLPARDPRRRASTSTASSMASGGGVEGRCRSAASPPTGCSVDLPDRTVVADRPRALAYRAGRPQMSGDEAPRSSLVAARRCSRVALSPALGQALGAQGPQQRRAGRRRRRPDRGPGPRRPGDLLGQCRRPPGRSDAERRAAHRRLFQRRRHPDPAARRQRRRDRAQPRPRPRAASFAIYDLDRRHHHPDRRRHPDPRRNQRAAAAGSCSTSTAAAR